MPQKHCPHCNPAIDFNELGNGTRPPTFSFNPGNNSGGIYNSGGSSSSTNGIFSNIPSDFIDNWKQLDRECRNNIEAIQAIVGALSPEAWECMGQSCGVQEGANGAESGGTSNSMTDDVLDVLNHELNGATLVDPCNPNKPHQALMSELIESLCGGEYMGRGDVFKSLNSSDIIIGDQSLNDCQNAKCMLRLLNDPSIKLYCNTVGNFMGNVNNSLKIEINYSSSVSSTGYDPNTNLITITLAGLGGACDGNPLEMASEILHEAVHAELFREVVEGHQNPFDPVSYEEMWNMALKLRWPDWEAPYVTAQHEVMANMYVQEIAQALQSVDNNRYSIDYYLYLAWAGLSVHGSYLGFVDYYISEYYDEYEFLMAQPFDRCD
ncbi:MAG: hypothetical protein IPJ06_17080 [Saprospiraceae bacterium]|nr:hypothetical protein [Saprospiraceae bacterium]